MTKLVDEQNRILKKKTLLSPLSTVLGTTKMLSELEKIATHALFHFV